MSEKNSEIRDVRQGSLLRKIALIGPLSLSATTCEDTREEVSQVVKDESLPEPKAEEIPSSPPKILIADRSVSEGLKSMAELAPGRSWLGKLEGNGNRDVMVYLPEHFEYDKPYELIYFFHGTGCHEVRPPEADLSGDRFGKYLPKQAGWSGFPEESREPCAGTRALSQVLGASERAQEEDFNQAVVYPLSAGSRGTEKMQDLLWMREDNSTSDSMALLDRESRTVLESMGVEVAVKKVTIKGHSAGGAPLNNILASGFPADRVDYLDATYWKWGPFGKKTPYGLRNAYDSAMKANPEMEINVFVHYPGKKTDLFSQFLEGKPGVVRIDARGRDFEGHSITHGKMMRNYWNWQR